MTKADVLIALVALRIHMITQELALGGMLMQPVIDDDSRLYELIQRARADLAGAYELACDAIDELNNE